MKNQDLWNRIEAFPLDHPENRFTFSHRLARDNNWGLDYTSRVILEYKKFIYLCCAGYGEITPSDAVDQAWHLHLTYTRSYWVDLCRYTLGMQIHHNPTAGGDSEKKRYAHDYDTLKDAYIREFGHPAPQDIWPDNKDRFNNIDFKRINLSEYWLIRKPRSIGPRAVLLLLPIVALLFIQSENLVPWGTIVFVAVLLLIVARTIKGGKGGRGRGGSDSGCSWWGGFWGCSGDSDSGCSSAGCSGCGGSGD